MDPKVKQSWEEFLNPEIMRSRLIATSIYIAGFEILKDSIVGRIRDFFCTDFDKTGDKIDPKYQAEILSRNKSPVYASLEWLKDMETITAADITVFNHIKACRNSLAHNLFSVLGSNGLPDDFKQCFSNMIDLLRKIEVWWIINVEIPTSPDFDGREVDANGIVPGPVMSMQLLMDIALGDEERSQFYYNEFRKHTNDG